MLIARVLSAAHLTVHAGCHKMLRQGRTEQQMIDAETGVRPKAFRKYFHDV